MYPVTLGKSPDSTLLASFYGMGKKLGGGGLCEHLKDTLTGSLCGLHDLCPDTHTLGSRKTRPQSS